MEHTIPASHKELLQEILKTLIQTNDPEATFILAAAEETEAPEIATLGQ